eukprot:Pgem_evm1s16411
MISDKQSKCFNYEPKFNEDEVEFEKEKILEIFFDSPPPAVLPCYNLKKFFEIELLNYGITGIISVGS